MDANDCTSQPIVVEALQILKGAVTIVYPMGLPPHDPIRAELENTEDLSGTQVHILLILFSYNEDIPILISSSASSLTECSLFH